MIRASVLGLSVAMGLAGCADSIHNEAARGDVEALRARFESNADACLALNREDKTALHYAINFAQRDSFLFLVEGDRCDPNAADHSGMTPLHCAAFIGLPAAVPMLVEAGANIDARDTFGDTPLHTAAMKGYTDMVNALIDAGADPSVKNNDGRTPHDLAVFYGQSDAATILEPAP